MIRLAVITCWLFAIVVFIVCVINANEDKHIILRILVSLLAAALGYKLLYFITATPLILWAKKKARSKIVKHFEVGGEIEAAAQIARNHGLSQNLSADLVEQVYSEVVVRQIAEENKKQFMREDS